MKYKEVKHNLADYINGHLSQEQALELENELKQSSELRGELNDLKTWQTQLKHEQLDVPSPRFSTIEAKLTKPTWSFKHWGYGLSTAATIALVAVLSFEPNIVPNNEFETLTRSTSLYSEPVLQLVLTQETNIDEFVAEHQLSILQSYPNTHIIDVKLNESLQSTLHILKTDERIVLTKKIGTKNEQ